MTDSTDTGYAKFRKELLNRKPVIKSNKEECRAYSGAFRKYLVEAESMVPVAPSMVMAHKGIINARIMALSRMHADEAPLREEMIEQLRKQKEVAIIGDVPHLPIEHAIDAFQLRDLPSAEHGDKSARSRATIAHQALNDLRKATWEGADVSAFATRLQKALFNPELPHQNYNMTTSENFARSAVHDVVEKARHLREHYKGLEGSKPRGL